VSGTEGRDGSLTGRGTCRPPMIAASRGACSSGIAGAMERWGRGGSRRPGAFVGGCFRDRRAAFRADAAGVAGEIIGASRADTEGQTAEATTQPDGGQNRRENNYQAIRNNDHLRSGGRTGRRRSGRTRAIRKTDRDDDRFHRPKSEAEWIGTHPRGDHSLFNLLRRGPNAGYG